MAAAFLAIAFATAHAADKSGTRPTAISVPKGPGSVEGLGESFQVNLNSGSVAEVVALKVPPGTAGQAPQLALSYDSGQGNGPLGLGWTLGLPTIQLQTEKGLPKYDGTDVLLLQGATPAGEAAGLLSRVRASHPRCERPRPAARDHWARR